MKISLWVVLAAAMAIAAAGCTAPQVQEVPAAAPPSQVPAITSTPGIPVAVNTTMPGPANRIVNLSGTILPGDSFLAPMGVYYEGDVVTVHGTTILSPGNPLLVEVVSSSFGPVPKSSRQWFTGVSGVVQVQQGPPGGKNTWSFSFPTDGFEWDTYIVTVSGLEVNVRDTTTFELRPRV